MGKRVKLDKTDWIYIAIFAALVLTGGNYLYWIWQCSEECDKKGGVLAQGYVGPVCVEGKK